MKEPAQSPGRPGRPELGRSGSQSRCSAWPPPGARRRSRTAAQWWRPQTQFLSPGSAAAAASSRSAGCPPWYGGAQQHVRVAALVHRAGDARVVHFVETLHGLVAVVLSALQQVMHGHVVVDVVAALAVGEDLDALDEAGGVGRGRGQRVGAVRVPDAEGDLDGLGVDEGRAAGQRDAADPRGCGGEGAQRAGEVLHVMPRRHVAGVACFQLVVQALHQLILGSGGDYLHACLYTRILIRAAKENYSSRAYIDVRPVRMVFCGAKSGKKAILVVRI